MWRIKFVPIKPAPPVTRRVFCCILLPCFNRLLPAPLSQPLLSTQEPVEKVLEP
jgi:hypothetical protein